METGGSSKGEVFDIEESMNTMEKLQSLRFARKAIGDEALKGVIGQDPGLLEAHLAERMADNKKRLLRLATT